jgi:hypothetical protein
MSELFLASKRLSDQLEGGHSVDTKEFTGATLNLIIGVVKAAILVPQETKWTSSASN